MEDNHAQGSQTPEEILENQDLLFQIQGIEMIEKGGCIKAMEEYSQQQLKRSQEENFKLQQLHICALESYKEMKEENARLESIATDYRDMASNLSEEKRRLQEEILRLKSEIAECTEELDSKDIDLERERKRVEAFKEENKKLHELFNSQNQ